MKYKVEKAETWEQVCEASVIQTRCIRPTAGNHDQAQQTFEVFSKSNDIIYFLLKENSTLRGYVRLLCVNSGNAPKTWITDFVSPSLYEPVVLAAREVTGTVLVKEFQADDDLLIKQWSRLGAAWPKLERYPYHCTPVTESAWLVVRT